MKLLRRKGKVKEKWRIRARMVNMRRTKVILSPSKKPKEVPLWVYRKLFKKD